MANKSERVYKLGDYCLDTIKSIVEGYSSMNDLFEELHNARDLGFKEKLVAYINNYLAYIDLCINEANSLLTTIPLVVCYMNNVVDVKELESFRDKLIDIKKNQKTNCKMLSNIHCFSYNMFSSNDLVY